MYGMVNKAVQELVCTQFGAPVWEKIKEKAGFDAESFVSMETYPDQVTYRLVDAASEVLGISGAQVLEAFGEYWTRYTAKEGYGDLLRMSGRTLPEFLMNLDNMHARIALSFPALKPPSFKCSEVTERSLTVHYYSEREGLAPLVTGLLRGLGSMFEVNVSVEHTAKRREGAHHDEFHLEMQAR